MPVPLCAFGNMARARGRVFRPRGCASLLDATWRSAAAAVCAAIRVWRCRSVAPSSTTAAAPGLAQGARVPGQQPPRHQDDCKEAGLHDWCAEGVPVGRPGVGVRVCGWGASVLQPCALDVAGCCSHCLPPPVGRLAAGIGIHTVFFFIYLLILGINAWQVRRGGAVDMWGVLHCSACCLCTPARRLSPLARPPGAEPPPGSLPA